MEFRRFFKNLNKNFNITNLNEYFILIDNKSLKRPTGYPLIKLFGLIKNIKITTQSKKPKLPPNTEEINLPLTISVDDNYLYIWIESKQKWKRILLSDW